MKKIRSYLIQQSLQLHNNYSNFATKKDSNQCKVLRKLIKKAKNTAFGQYYNFEEILQATELELIEHYQKQVPIHNYDQIFDRWWSKMLEGTPNICWPNKIDYFAMSSGTSGAPSKYIPVSKDMLKSIQVTNKRFFSSIASNFDLPASFFDSKFLILGSSVELTPHGDVWLGDISGINARHIPGWSHYFYKPGKEIAQLKDWNNRLEEMVKEAPKWDIAAVGGIPSWVQILLENIVEYHQLKNITEIWPNLRIYASGGIALGPYKKRLNELIGKELIYLDTYYTSEGSLAYQQSRSLSNDEMPLRLSLNNGIFFEFIPFNQENFNEGQLKSTAKAIRLQETENGKEYALVISTCSGAWRYLIGDTVKIFNKENAEILITGRIKHFLSICGEHLSVDNMNAGITELENVFNIDIAEFTVKALKVEQHYEHHWFIGCNNIDKYNSTTLTQHLDAYLKSINADYATERQDNLLKRIVVHLIPKEKFYNWQAQKGKTGGQSKFPRVLDDEQFRDWMQFKHAKNA